MISLVTTPCRADGAFITAAINWPGGKAQFFLSDGTYVRYDIAADRADPGYPKPVDDGTWPGMGGYGTKIIAAFNTRDNKAIFILSTGDYLRYDIASDRVDPGYPRPVNDETWPGLEPFASSISGAINWANGKVYIFFSDGRYVRYDIAADHVDAGYPKPINEQTWPGLNTYFQKKSSGLSTRGKFGRSGLG